MCRGPGIEERLRIIDPAGPVRAAIPMAVRTLQCKQLAAPTLGGHAYTLGSHLVRGCVGEVAHHLPANCRVGVEQPLDERHRRSLPTF